MRTLLDRHLSEYEGQALAQMASLLGLDVTGLKTVHQDYLTGLAAVAWADGLVTDQERSDLDLVAALLGLDHSDVTEALRTASTGGTAPRHEIFQLHPGDSICLTGQMTRPRSDIDGTLPLEG